MVSVSSRLKIIIIRVWSECAFNLIVCLFFFFENLLLKVISGLHIHTYITYIIYIYVLVDSNKSESLLHITKRYAAV